jgi:hypothetical protein
MRIVILLSASAAFVHSFAVAEEQATVRSHPPMRPLPAGVAGDSPAQNVWFVDPHQGVDSAEGSRERPWKTLVRGLQELSPGATLVLRGGTYYETARIGRQGRADAPITLQAFPGEVAVIDAGYREFFDAPGGAWQHCDDNDAASGEFVSSGTYPELAAPPDPARPMWGSGSYSEQVKVLGNFGDSLVPLHGYHTVVDLRSNNPYWNLGNKLETETGLYCGPGLWFNAKTGRIHARLAHTPTEWLGPDEYRGETDPRRLPLIISGAGTPLTIDRSAHVRIRNIVLRGSRSHALTLTRSQHIELDGVTLFGGCPGMYVRDVAGLRMVDCALRGIAAPWSSRAAHKYRGISPYLFVADSGNRDFEITQCEFTDGHDGAVIGAIDSLRFERNLVENFNDDGLYLTVERPGGRNGLIAQNRIARCLSSLAFAGDGARQEGSEIDITRNIFDLRQPVYKAPKKSDAEPGEFQTAAQIVGDHGSPIWKPMRIYHNTFILPDSAWRGYYGGGLSGAMNGTTRRVFNNIFTHVRGLPAFHFLKVEGDFLADGNLHWSHAEGPGYSGDFLTEARKVRPKQADWFTLSQSTYPGGWTARDQFADPQFTALPHDWAVPADLRLRSSSPAVNAGIAIPPEWPDPLRAADPDAPDIGALPADALPWGVGVRGRVSLFGAAP